MQSVQSTSPIKQTHTKKSSPSPLIQSTHSAAMTALSQTSHSSMEELNLPLTVNTVWLLNEPIEEFKLPPSVGTLKNP